jgi:small subunit ribosomal protein S8
MMTDPIADMLTRIRNANRIERPLVEMQATRLKRDIAAVLMREGFINSYEIGRYVQGEDGVEVFQPATLQDPKPILRIILKYGSEGEKVIRQIDRASKPGRRLYVPASRIPKVLDGLGIAILSTNKGVLSDRDARALRVGGELICTVW